MTSLYYNFLTLKEPSKNKGRHKRDFHLIIIRYCSSPCWEVPRAKAYQRPRFDSIFDKNPTALSEMNGNRSVLGIKCDYVGISCVWYLANISRIKEMFGKQLSKIELAKCSGSSVDSFFFMTCKVSSTFSIFLFFMDRVTNGALDDACPAWKKSIKIMAYHFCTF